MKILPQFSVILLIFVVTSLVMPLDGKSVNDLSISSKKQLNNINIRDTSLINDNTEEYLSDHNFSPVKVLCEVNGYTVPAIIDTGAQMTIISNACAKRCRILNLIDTKFSGRAIGVGSTEIVGRINDLNIRVGPMRFDSKVAVLRESPVEFLIGMDFLRRFKCDICLTEGVLKLRVRDRYIRVPLINDRKSYHGFNHDEVEINDNYNEEQSDDTEDSEYNNDSEEEMNNPYDNYDDLIDRREYNRKSHVHVYSAKSKGFENHKSSKESCTTKRSNCDKPIESISMEGV